MLGEITTVRFEYEGNDIGLKVLVPSTQPFFYPSVALIHNSRLFRNGLDKFLGSLLLIVVNLYIKKTI